MYINFHRCNDLTEVFNSTDEQLGVLSFQSHIGNVKSGKDSSKRWIFSSTDYEKMMMSSINKKQGFYFKRQRMNSNLHLNGAGSW